MAEILSQLYSELFKANRMEDAKCAANNPEYRDMLLKEFNLDVEYSNISFV